MFANDHHARSLPLSRGPRRPPARKVACGAMRAVVQRVSRASVTVDGRVTGAIEEPGLLVRRKGCDATHGVAARPEGRAANDVSVVGSRRLSRRSWRANAANRASGQANPWSCGAQTSRRQRYLLALASMSILASSADGIPHRHEIGEFERLGFWTQRNRQAGRRRNELLRLGGDFSAAGSPPSMTGTICPATAAHCCLSASGVVFCCWA